MVHQETLSNQRHHLRYRAGFSAVVKTEQGDELSATIDNISQAGLQISACQEVMKTVMPNEHNPGRAGVITITVSFKTPTSYSAETDVCLTCNVIYTRREAMDRFLLGCHFVGFENDGEEVLLNFLTHFGEAIM